MAVIAVVEEVLVVAEVEIEEAEEAFREVVVEVSFTFCELQSQPQRSIRGRKHFPCIMQSSWNKSS